MRVTYVADGREPIARGWIRHAASAKGGAVQLLSTYPCERIDVDGVELHNMPVALTHLLAPWNPDQPAQAGPVGSGRFRLPKAATVTDANPAVFAVRHGLAPWTYSAAVRRGRPRLDAFEPDLVHALRLPHEGFVAARLAGDRPLVGSVWGNDFTLFAARSKRLSRLTDAFLSRADGLVCDCQRDLDLAIELGFAAERPGIVLPGGGGVDTDVFKPGPRDSAFLAKIGVPQDAPIVFNPRGLRAYAKTATWLDMMPLVLNEHPDAVFVATGMDAAPWVRNRIERLRVSKAVRLLPKLSFAEFVKLNQAATVMCSLTDHDGTANSLIEALASGAVPVAGRIASASEWITDGESGFLCDPNDPQAAATAVSAALADDALQRRAAALNVAAIEKRASRRRVSEALPSFYQAVLDDVRTRRGWQPARQAADRRN